MTFSITFKGSNRGSGRYVCNVDDDVDCRCDTSGTNTEKLFCLNGCGCKLDVAKYKCTMNDTKRVYSH